MTCEYLRDLLHRQYAVSLPFMVALRAPVTTDKESRRTLAKYSIGAILWVVCYVSSRPFFFPIAGRVYLFLRVPS